MSEVAKRSSLWVIFLIVAASICLFAFMIIPNFVREPVTSPANACINNLRRIDAAKERWELEHHAKTNDVVTLNDIRPYLERDLDPRGKP